MSVIIKATQDSTTRRIPFQGPPTLESLRNQLSAHFTIPEEARITYKDEDGDDITFSTDSELEQQISAVGKTQKGVLRLTIFTSTTPPPSQAPQIDTLVTSISELVTVIRETTAPPPAKRVCLRTPKPDRPKPDRPGRAEPRTTGLFSGLRPLFSAFPQGPKLRASVKAIDHDTKVSFKTTVTAIKNSKERKAILSGLKTAAPALREFMTDLPDDGLPTVERVNVFVTAVEACLRGTDDTVVPQISEFIVNAASDPGLVDCFRKVRNVPVMPWEPGFVKRVATTRGFDVHQVTCAGCEKSPIVGTRYESPADGFNLCAECYKKDNLTQGHNFVERKYVWEKNYEGVKVPPPTMKIGDKGNKVKFLHKVLTDLGFMNSSMYLRRPGLFSENTKKAVAAFQAENNIAGEAGVYDQVTANRLNQVVSEREMTEGTGDNAVEETPDTAMKV